MNKSDETDSTSCNKSISPTSRIKHKLLNVYGEIEGILGISHLFDRLTNFENTRDNRSCICLKKASISLMYSLK